MTGPRTWLLQKVGLCDVAILVGTSDLSSAIEKIGHVRDSARHNFRRIISNSQDHTCDMLTFTSLPVELRLQIANFLTLSERLTLASVSRKFDQELDRKGLRDGWNILDQSKQAKLPDELPTAFSRSTDADLNRCSFVFHIASGRNLYLLRHVSEKQSCWCLEILEYVLKQSISPRRHFDRTRSKI